MSDPVDPGTVLFDGTINMAWDEEEDSLSGEVELPELPLGASVNVTFNGTLYSGSVEGAKNLRRISIELEDGFIDITQGTDGSFVYASQGVASDGANSLKIEQTGSAEFAVTPPTVHVNIGSAAPVVITGGTVGSYASSDESIAVVLENSGNYLIRGVAEGNCSVTFTSTEGKTATVSVEVTRNV